MARDEALDLWSTMRDPAFLADPHPTFDALRAQAAIHRDAGSGVYFVLGHAAFSKVMRSPSIGRDTRQWANSWWSDPGFRERDPAAFELYSGFQPQMISTDPPDHGRMRGVFEPAFRAQAVATLTAMVEEETDRVLAMLPRDGRPVNLIEAYAAPLPPRLLRRLFDVPESLDARLGEWSAALIQIADLTMTEAQKRNALRAMREFREVLRALLAARGGGRDESLMALALDALRAGALSEDEALTNLMGVLVAGYETTVTLIGNGLMALLRHPGEMTRLRADPSLGRGAVEEILRYDPGGNLLLRVVREDVEIDGVMLPAGAAVLGVLRATNRDPERFADPHRFDIGRGGNAHHTFGGGIHVCLGAPLARLQGRVAILKLLDAFGRIELVEPPVWREIGVNARTLETLRVRLSN
jgi:cytochrome P450